MKKADFVEVLKKLGACPDGLQMAANTPGKVTTIAKKWAKPRGRKAPVKRAYFEWLATTIRDDGNSALSNLVSEEIVEVRRVVGIAEPDFEKRKYW